MSGDYIFQVTSNDAFERSCAKSRIISPCAQEVFCRSADVEAVSGFLHSFVQALELYLEYGAHVSAAEAAEIYCFIQAVEELWGE